MYLFVYGYSTYINGRITSYVLFPNKKVDMRVVRYKYVMIYDILLVSICFNLNRLNCITPTTKNYHGNTGSFYSQAKKRTLKENPPWNWPYTCIASLISPQKKMERI